MITFPFTDVINAIRTAKKGVEVRENLAQMGEYCKQFTEEAGTRADTAKEAAETAATNAKASEKKATDAVAGIEQTKTDAVQAVQNAQTTATNAVQQAQSTATTAVTTKQTEAVQAVRTAQTGAVKAVDDERDAALQQVANSTKAATTAASNAAASEQAAQASKEAAAISAGSAESSATAASGSASAAATSESNAASSAQSAETDADRAEAAAELAGTRANTDKTLTTENAPADAKAVGDYILDAEGNVIFHSKTAVDKLLEGKLGLHDTADNSVKWGDMELRKNHNQSDTWIPVFSEGNMDYVLKQEIADLNGVIASGSNYVRFSDGTQICWGNAIFGSMNANASSYASVIFSLPFIDTNYITSSNQIHDSGYTSGCFVNMVNRQTTQVDVSVYNDANVTVTPGTQYSVIAIGRWK